MQLDLIIRLSDNLIVRLVAQLATGFENEASASSQGRISNEVRS